jgi:pyroglutamyl-peptidase
MKVLITGFGPFPGAPFNPTGPLVMALARRRRPAGVCRVAHVFPVTYEAVDRELPALIARERPDALIMFGLASRTKHLRIETWARNARTRAVPDAGGHIPRTAMILSEAPAGLPLRLPARRLLRAAQSAGVPAALSRDAGRYLCNYLCWRATETVHNGGLRLAAFIHVPLVPRVAVRPSHRSRLTLRDLVEAGDAIVRAAATAARRPVNADS